MALNLPSQQTPSQVGPSLGGAAGSPNTPSQAPGSGTPTAPGQASQEQNPNAGIPMFMEQNMRKAAPQEQELVKKAIMEYPPLGDVFGIMIDPLAREYIAAVTQRLGQAQQNSPQGLPTPVPENAGAPQGAPAQQPPAMATPTAPQGM